MRKIFVVKTDRGLGEFQLCGMRLLAFVAAVLLAVGVLAVAAAGHATGADWSITATAPAGDGSEGGDGDDDGDDEPDNANGWQ